MIASTQIEQARRANLLRLVEPDTTLIRIANTHGGEYAGPCPFCGGTDRFHVVPTTGKWYCRQCTPRGGDAIDYVQRRAQVVFQTAVNLLTGSTAWAARAAPMVQLRTHTKAPAWPALHWMRPAWQQAAHARLQTAEAALADAVTGLPARAYLAERGLQPATWQTWRLGFYHAWHPVRREALPAITLPWFGADGALQAIQYRFFGPEIARHDRFSQKAGGQRSLFGLSQRNGRETLIITEGELNAISCWQVAQSWADVLSIGSQENIRQAHVSEALKSIAVPYRRVIAWLDERARALTVADQIAPLNGAAVWSKNDLDANDLLQRGLLAARLANALADASWEPA
jgi:hypothetical protein